MESCRVFYINIIWSPSFDIYGRSPYWEIFDLCIWTVVVFLTVSSESNWVTQRLFTTQNFDYTGIDSRLVRKWIAQILVNKSLTMKSCCIDNLPKTRRDEKWKSDCSLWIVLFICALCSIIGFKISYLWIQREKWYDFLDLNHNFLSC